MQYSEREMRFGCRMEKNVLGFYFMLLYYLALNRIEMREQAEYKLLHT